MADAVSLAKNARATLSDALQALQSDDTVPEALLDIAEPIAKTMGILHRIEASNGQELGGRDEALDNVRGALEALQKCGFESDAVDAAMEAVAGSLSKLFALSRAAAPKAAARARSHEPASRAKPRADDSREKARRAEADRKAQERKERERKDKERRAREREEAQRQEEERQRSQRADAQRADAQRADAQRADAQRADAQRADAERREAERREAERREAERRETERRETERRETERLHNEERKAREAKRAREEEEARAQERRNAETQQAASEKQSRKPATKKRKGDRVPGMTDAPLPHSGIQRVSVELGAHSGSNFYKGLSGNDVIEHGGIFVQTYKIPKMGSAVALTMLLPGDLEFEADAIVQWTRETRTGETDPGFGAKFTRISSEGRQLVYRYTRNREPIFYDDL